jgi:prohibitin 1
MLELQLPSKEGLSVKASISILYHLDKKNFENLLRNYGLSYEPIITAIFRSASSDVCAQFFAKDMHSGKRADIESAIKGKMLESLTESGIVIESVLMKSIVLPDGLAQSIEEKLRAEQDAMRMDFVLLQAKKEAERKIIEATGTRDAQLIQAEGLTPEILKMKSIEAFRDLSGAPGTKVIVTDGRTPFLIKD